MEIKAKMKVDSQRGLRAAVTTESEKLKNLKPGQEVFVKITTTNDKRSLPANNLFHRWCREAAKYFKIAQALGRKPEDRMKDVFKHLFLGYEEADQVGTIKVAQQLKKTSELDKGEMCHFMEQVESWCAEKECFLSRPADSEYMKWQEEQNR